MIEWRFLPIFFLISGIQLCAAKVNYKDPATTLVFSCMLIISRSYVFDYQDDNFWRRNCQYQPIVASFTACFKESDLDFGNSLDGFLSMCADFGGVKLTKDQLYEIDSNGTQYLLDPSKDKTSGVLHRPVIPDPHQVKGVYKLFSHYFDTVERASDFGNLLNRYLIIALLTIGCFNWIKTTRMNKLLTNRLINWIRSTITVPTLLQSHLHPYDLGICETLLPTTQESILILFYIAICIYGVTTKYSIYLNNALFKDKFSQWTRFVADRTGIISFTQLPLLFLFGGRNNLLIKITGLQYNSFIMFHKWISRVMFSCAFIHGICYLMYSNHYRILAHDFQERYWIFGCIALVACITLMVQAIYRFRKICYEWFLLIHIVMLLLFIICCVVHCWNIGWLQYCYYSVGFWLLDRFLRIYKIYQFGFPQATIQVLSTQDPTLKISIPKPANYITFPGSYIFIHFLSLDFKFWESHPFTIYDHDDKLIIIMKPKAGMTSSLYHNSLKLKDNTFQLKVAIEGPYGHHVPKKYCQQTMLLAGGNGIPGPFYHALSMLKHSDSENASCNVKLCWVIRDLESLVWFYKETQLIVDKIDIEIYVTREKLPTYNNYGSITDGGASDRAFQSLSEHSGIKFFNSRPDFLKMLRNEILSKDLNNLNVISCGNPVMCDHLRDNCAELIKEFNKVKIDLFEELQVW